MFQCMLQSSTAATFHNLADCWCSLSVLVGSIPMPLDHSGAAMQELLSMNSHTILGMSYHSVFIQELLLCCARRNSKLVTPLVLSAASCPMFLYGHN
jgi:hypothetical protein